jgi:hypothetical protein
MSRACAPGYSLPPASRANFVCALPRHETGAPAFCLPACLHIQLDPVRIKRAGDDAKQSEIIEHARRDRVEKKTGLRVEREIRG